MALDELHAQAAERAEIGAERVTLLRPDRADERAREHHAAGLEHGAEAADLVREPSDAHRRMAEHAGGDAGLLDVGIAVEKPADPAEIDVHRPHRAPTDDETGG